MIHDVVTFYLIVSIFYFSEWFGAYQDGSFESIWDFHDTPWYKNDLFGLKTLDEQKKVFFNTTDGNHLDFSTDYLLDLVGLYFE